MKKIYKINFRLYLNRTCLHLYNTSFVFFKIKRSVTAKLMSRGSGSSNSNFNNFPFTNVHVRDDFPPKLKIQLPETGRYGRKQFNH